MLPKVYRAPVIGAALPESDPEEALGTPGPGWLSRRLTRPWGRVTVLVDGDTLDPSDELFERLADQTAKEALAGPALFADVTEKRVPAVLPPEYFLRRFRSWPAEKLFQFLREWGPLDIPEQPRDVWTTWASLGLHLDEVDERLNRLQRNCPEDGRTFVVTVGHRQLHLQGYSVELQDLAFQTYQAVVGTIVDLVLKSEHLLEPRAGLSKADLDAHLPRSTRLIWEERELPVPTTVGEALDSVVGLLVRAAAPSAPHLELRSNTEQEPSLWEVGRGILGALALQVITAVSDGAPARECQRCHKLFLRQVENRHQSHQHGTRVKFCSRECAQQEAQQRYRERLRGR